MAPPPGRPGKRKRCRAGGGCSECAARRSQELTLLAGGSCSWCTSGSGLRPCPLPPPACVTFQECWQRLPHLERVSGGSRRPLRRLSPARGGAPPGFPGSSLLWLPAEAPGQAHGWTTDRKGQQDLAFSPWSWGTSGTSCLAPMVERGKVGPGGI